MPRVLEALQGNSGAVRPRVGPPTSPAAATWSCPRPERRRWRRRRGRPVGRHRVDQPLHQRHQTTDQSFEDNDVTNIDDRDTTVDSSVNQNITAFGDVNQDFDNDVVSGDGAVAAGDNAQVNTGDGAVQAGDDIEDSNVATGNVERLGPRRRHQRLGRGRRQPGHRRLDGRGRQLRRGRRHQRRGRERPPGRRHHGRRRQRRRHPQPGRRRRHPDRRLNLSESVVGDGTVQSNDIAIDADDGSLGRLRRRATAPPPRPRTSTSTATRHRSRSPTTPPRPAVTDNSINDSSTPTTRSTTATTPTTR